MWGKERKRGKWLASRRSLERNAAALWKDFRFVSGRRLPIIVTIIVTIIMICRGEGGEFSFINMIPLMISVR